MFEVREKPQKVERALLVGVQRPDMPAGEAEALVEELRELVETLDIPVLASRVVTLRETQPKFLIGSGKANELIELAKREELDVIVFDDELTPGQQRNWELASGVCVIDRQEVILDIFAQRAQTREAILQVGLARMIYSLPRLKRAWTHLSRQRGGGGTVVRGQGETQLESDRRLVQDRIARLRREIGAVVKHRGVQRKRRAKNGLPGAAIVGYTNAGKSSLLNRLTGSSALAEDKLFATLDPTTRRLDLDNGQKILLTDTVGFVRRLPHNLIDAFRATLEEAILSDFLIHVLDVTNPEVEQHHTTTLEVLKELGADTKRIITVFNKTDGAIEETRLAALHLLHPDACFISARTGEGIDALVKRIADMLADALHSMRLLIPHDRHDLIGRLHRLGCVRRQTNLDEGVLIESHVPPEIRGLFEPFSLPPERIAHIA